MTIKRLKAEAHKLREACASGWGEPTLINFLKADNETLRQLLGTLDLFPDQRAMVDRVLAEMAALRGEEPSQ